MNQYNPANVEKPQLPLNRKLQDSLNNVINEYTSKSQHPRSSVYALSPDEITYLQAYLEQVKISQINKSAVQTNIKKCTSIGDGGPMIQCNMNQSNQSVRHNQHNQQNQLNQYDRHNTNDMYNNNVSTRNGKKSTNNVPYYNSYEVGARQDELGSLYKPTYTGPYNARPDLLADIGLDNRMYWEKFPGAVRNVNVESLLYQGEMTHLPGQRNLTQTEINRFELLPFDPQDTKHIVWTDNMPRGGYPTRVDRLETL